MYYVSSAQSVQFIIRRYITKGDKRVHTAQASFAKIVSVARVIAISFWHIAILTTFLIRNGQNVSAYFPIDVSGNFGSRSLFFLLLLQNLMYMAKCPSRIGKYIVNNLSQIHDLLKILFNFPEMANKDIFSAAVAFERIHGTVQRIWHRNAANNKFDCNSVGTLKLSKCFNLSRKIKRIFLVLSRFLLYIRLYYIQEEENFN